TGDLGIGQVWEDFITAADVVLPMVYPSHYYRGSYGLAWPNGEPYRVVHNALSEAIQRSSPFAQAAIIRPYLQAFTLGRRKPRYVRRSIPLFSTTRRWTARSPAIRGSTRFWRPSCFRLSIAHRALRKEWTPRGSSASSSISMRRNAERRSSAI